MNSNKQIITELTEIRKNILLGVDENDLLYIKMQVNRIDNLLYKLNEPTIEIDTNKANLTIPVVSESLLDKIDELNTDGLGCGLEDVGITDRYEAMEYGFEQCIERVKEVLS